RDHAALARLLEPVEQAQATGLEHLLPDDRLHRRDNEEHPEQVAETHRHLPLTRGTAFTRGRTRDATAGAPVGAREAAPPPPCPSRTRRCAPTTPRRRRPPVPQARRRRSGPASRTRS